MSTSYFAGCTVLVTGASAGIGREFARQLASVVGSMILVARRADRLEALELELKVINPGLEVFYRALDLRNHDDLAKFCDWLEESGLTVDLLINNAGFATYGAFDRLDAERERQEVLLNVAAVVDLTHRFLPAMLARGGGAIVNVASTSAFQPTPYMAVYGASKAFVLSFSEALWAEYRSKGIRVLALCPGPTSTDFFNVVGTEDASFGTKETPEKVVAVALRALQRGRPSVISGRMNWLQANSVRLAPRALVASMGARLMLPGHSGGQAKA